VRENLGWYPSPVNLGENLVSKSLFGIGLIALIAVGCKGGNSSSGEVLAIVNGETIPMSSYFKTMERKQRVSAVVNPASLTVDTGSGRVLPQVALVEVRPSLAFQALQECIANEIIRQVAKDQGVYPTPQQVEAEIKLEEERNPNFVKDTSKDGLSIEQIKNELALRLARLGLQAKGVTVTDAEVDAFIKENPVTFTQPAAADLIYMEVADEKTKALADKELKEGQMFAAVAQHYSLQANGKEVGFKFPVRNINSMAPALQKLINETPEFNATKWVYDDGTKHWVKFYVQRKTKAQPVPITNYIKQMVKRELQRKKGTRANDPDKRVADALKTAKIEIKVKYLEEPWKKAFTELTKNKEEKPAAK
jgi:hypothetical protein